MQFSSFGEIKTMDTTFTNDPQLVSLGLLIGRVVLGLLLAAHGAQKLFGWFGGYGLNATGEFMVQLGFPNGRLFAGLSGLGEFSAGLLLALGFLGPIGPAIAVAGMIVAMRTVHRTHGLFASHNGIELPLLYATGATAFAFISFGRYSLDAAFGLTHLWTAPVIIGALLIGVIGALVNLAIRHTPQPRTA
jgi:putative oxidoreductase